MARLSSVILLPDLFILIWFLVSMLTMLVLSKKNLWLAVLTAGFVLALSTSDFNTILIASQRMSSVENVLLALALMQIPVIGKLLERPLAESVSLLDRRAASIIGPATFGLLPVPGGAVLSCPLVDRIISDDLPVDKKAALNVWFRHVTFFVYPLSTAIIIAAALSELDLMVAIVHMLPMLAMSIIIGYMFYLRGLRAGKNEGNGLHPGAIAIVILAPVIQAMSGALGASMELGAFVGVTTAFILSIFYTKSRLKELSVMVKQGKVWDFGLVYLAIMFYGYIFAQTKVSGVIYELSPPKLLLTVVIPFFIGLATGRVQLTLAIFIPLYKGLFGATDYFTLATMYTAASAGYIMSPLHPCLILTVKYFKSDLYGSIRELALPSILLTSFAAFYASFCTFIG